MRRREFITLLVGAAAASSFSWPLAARARERLPSPVVGVLMPGIPGVPSPADKFFVGMRDLGYVEGQNIVYHVKWGMGKGESLSRLATELVDFKPDVIVVSGGRAIDAVRHATQVIPVVVAFTSDLLGQGFVSSLARPEGNITGLSALSTEIAAKRIELVKEVFPKVRRLAVVWNSALTKNVRWPIIDASARSLAVELESFEIRDVATLDRAFAAMPSERIDAAYVCNDRFISTNRGRVIALASQHRIPAIYDFREYVDAGGLMSYGPSISDLHRRGAVFVDKIIHGAKPGDLPIEQPTKFELVINLKTAKALGAEIPDKLLALADEVIE